MHKIENLLVPKYISDKKRFGRHMDGGYVLYEPLLKNCKKLISLGCDNETSFEENILQVYPDIEIEIYDNFSNCDLAQNNNYNNVKFYKQYIDKDGFQKIEIPEHTIIKMDIEGSEYDILFNTNHININIDQFIIEYHFQDGLDVNKWIHILNLMNNFFNLIHIHGNNNSPQNKYGNVPYVIECTYINKNIIELNNIDTNNYPVLGLDYPNLSYKKDYILDWWK
jgi:hypothetical protein